MKTTFQLKEGVNFNDALNLLEKIAANEERIERDPHTNKHYVLRNGTIWKKGDGTGKYWDFLCDSRTAHKQAWELMGFS